MAHLLFRRFGSNRLRWIGNASKILLIDTTLPKVKVAIPRLNKKPALLNLDPEMPTISKAIDDFTYTYGTRVVLRTPEGEQLSLTTPVSDLLKEPFFVEFTDYLYNVFPLTYDPVKISLSPETKVVAEQYMIERGLSRSTASTLASFNTMLTAELKGKDKISTELLQVAIKKVLTSRSLLREYHEDYMAALYNLFKKQFARELQIMTEIDRKSTVSANRWVRSFWQVLLAQFFFTQYGTYYLYSWDIMEPITCMMTMGDAAAAYFFWIISRGQSYDAGGLWQFFYQRKRAKLLKKNKLSPTEMAFVQDLLEKLVPSGSHS